MITSLKLKNWRSHLDTNLKFENGTNCFIGSMGTGKTSILSGMCFGLFGTFPELQSKKVKLEDIIMKKPDQKERSEVEVGFNLNGDKWIVKRTISKGKTSAELRKNNQLVESQTKKVTEEIEKLLKVDYDLFTRAIYSEQNQLDMFLTIPKGQRMKKIDQLLAIDRFEKARTTVKSVTNKCKYSISEKMQFTETIVTDDNLKRLEFMKNEVVKLKDEQKKLIEKSSELARRKTSAVKNIDRLKDQEKGLRQIEEKTATNRALMESLTKDIDKLKEDLMDHAEKTTQDFRNNLQFLLEQAEELKNDLVKEKGSLDVLKETHIKEEMKISLIETEKLPELKKLIKEKSDLESQIKKISDIDKKFKEKTKQLEKQRIKLEKNELKIIELQESSDDLKKAGGACPVCDSRLDKNKKISILAKKRSIIKKLKEENKKINLKTIQNYIDKYQKELEELRSSEKRLNSIKNSDSELTKQEKQLKEIKSGLKFYLKKKRMFEKNVDLMQNKYSEILVDQEKIRQLISKRIDVEEKLRKSKTLEQEVADMRQKKLGLMNIFSPETLQRFEEEYRNLIGYERENKTRIESSQMMIGEKQRFIDELEKKKLIIDRYREEIQKLEFVSNQLSLLESSLVSTQEQLRKNFVYAVNQAMQSIWNDIYPYDDFFNIRLEVDGGDYVLQLQDSGGWSNADGTVSGGERSIACLALRIAFSLVLAPNMRMLVLDEPTANLDVNAINELAKVLKDKVTDIVDQIFLITHNPDLEAAVSGCLYRLDRDKSKDESTSVLAN